MASDNCKHSSVRVSLDSTIGVCDFCGKALDLDKDESEMEIKSIQERDAK